MGCDRFFENICFLIGSAYFVSGSYPEDEDDDEDDEAAVAADSGSSGLYKTFSSTSSSSSSKAKAKKSLFGNKSTQQRDLMTPLVDEEKAVATPL
jgi:hypothetical protein